MCIVEWFRSPYDMDWVTYSIQRRTERDIYLLQLNKMNAQESQTLSEAHLPDDGYHIDAVQKEFPRIPEPYQTFADTFEY